MSFRRRYSAYFDALFQEHLEEFDLLGIGLGVLFFPPLVFFVVLDNILLDHYVSLPIDLSIAWAIGALPFAMVVDGFLWFGEAADGLRQIFVDDPRPLAEWLENLLPLLFLPFGDLMRRCLRWGRRLGP
ncbi:hypothetical protein F4821DRAFT_279955 [Hypoxylon rubiginosum]|uniref:Uncharacterized protein n=1 Tax=Hypoxylon rubiginosum TaxID=110542 RepID=A0ACC0CWH8_9PEZI|nr:hypothetical protein F4821DRAFT_279955 [Hypoxylon rubiginosum]